MTTRKPLPEVYRQAADLIDRNGLCVGYYYDPDCLDETTSTLTGDAALAAVICERCPVCAAGGIILAAGATPDQSWRAAATALCRFADYLADRGDIDAAMLTPDTPEDALEAIGTWSDGCASAGQVTAALRAVADAAEGVSR
ncbi:MAG: hypothetical protein GEV03_22170 [Streptosporangiales bacterium]|nr:hypothetical protein [Streptosporangiales bacterium]